MFTKYGKKEGFPTSAVHSITEDENGVLWFATDNGLVRLPAFDFELIEYSSEFPIVDFKKCDDNKLWGYAIDGSFVKVEEQKINPVELSVQIKAEMGSQLINDVVFDSEGSIWISTLVNGGVIKLDAKTHAVINLTDKMPEDSYWISQLDSITYLVGANQTNEVNKDVLHISFIDKELEITLSGQEGVTQSKFLCLQDGSYLFAAGSEMVHFNSNKVLARLFTKKKIQSFCEDSEGKVWIGLLQGGLICFPTGEINSRNQIEYLGNTSVNFIYDDSNNNLWVGTQEQGLYNLQGGPHLAYQTPVITTGTNDTTRVRQTQAVRLEQDPNVLVLERVLWDTVPPEIFVSKIQVNNLDTTLHDKYELNAGQNFLRIGFVGSLPGNPGLFQYRYKMSGVNSEWIYTSTNSASYTMLPPGTYNFEVSAMSKEGVWSKQPAEVSFTIHPYFYQTSWFRAGVIVFVLFVITTSLMFYVRSLRKKEEERVAVNQRIADLELMALRAQMNPHFMFNTLSSIQHFVSANNTEEALRYLSKFAKLMRVVLDNSKKKEIIINDEIKAISLYLDLEKLRFKNKFEYQVEVGEGLDPSYDVIPSMLIQPYLENAVLHGINYKEGKGVISIKMNLEGDTIVCQVEDDGVGRKRSAEFQNKRSKNHKSQGMNITRDRLSIINKVGGSGLSVTVEDVNPNEENTGTRVRIYVPFNNT